ncbi:NB-ARC domain-containing protein [Kribbella sp. NBC_01505]|uniref:AfsR/SARP family transcriptional regulator n=1 Tax=Kribbella sp. NBC_01505 TaxID=2903580 RepID=UPI00386EB2F5
MRFAVLGRIEARTDDGLPVDLGHLRQQSVLAVLLIEHGRPVSADVLVDRVWGDAAPQRARETLYSYLSRLRRVLGDLVIRQPGGYLIDVDAEQIDLHRFRALVSAGSAAEALELWRGEPFAGLDTPWFVEQRQSLVAAQFAAELDLVDLRLEQGEHGQLLPGLKSRAEAHPLDERVARQLIDALHRAGRTAEALDQYDVIRRALSAELGIDPSAVLQQFHQRLLQKPAVTSVVPRQLPAAPGTFSGRLQALDQLSSVQSIAAVSGTGGVGKTSLVLHWAHHNLERFPDGQLFIDLRGFDPTDAPLPVSTALTAFLHALGAPDATIAADEQARVGAYRTLLAGKQMLIALDNAIDSSQVVPLLPGRPGCTVVVTSRSRLGGLLTHHSAVLIDLNELPPSDADEMLSRQVGAARRAAEPEAFAELLEHCAGLPLALAIVAARAGSRPDLPLSVLADELRESRLDALTTDELTDSLRSVFASSYRALSPEEAELFVLMALAPGPDLGTTAAASLIDQPVAHVRALLRRLESANLINQNAPGRYRIHDLLRLYAVEQHDPESRRLALRRLVDHYLFSTFYADRLLAPRRPQQQLADPEPGSRPVEHSDRAAAQQWLDTEHACVVRVQRLAASEGLHTRVWQLAWALNTFHNRTGQQTAQLIVWERALAAVPELTDPAVQALVLRFLGQTYAKVERHDEALRVLAEALRYAERDGSALVLGHAHQALAAGHERQGDYERALPHALEQLSHRRRQDPAWAADALNFVGWLYALSGRCHPPHQSPRHTPLTRSI